MTKEIIEGNKVFAEYLGYKYFPHNDPLIDTTGTYIGWIKPNSHPILPYFSLGRSHKELRFDTDWNRIMRVVEKIEENDSSIIIIISKSTVYISYMSDQGENSVIYETVGSSRITSIWKACLTYITTNRKEII